MTKRYAVIGDPIEHSRSPELYAPMFEFFNIDAVFLRLPVKKEELFRIREIVFENELSGFAVTMPHKRAILPFLDKIDETAASADSVNIVTVEGGRLVGHNTDGDGLANALTEAGVMLSGKSAVILGNGGAAAGARAALERRGCAVRTVSRKHCGNAAGSIEAAIAEAEAAEKALSCADILINATPLGMAGGADFADLSFIRSLKPSCAVFDMVYRPDGADTPLLAAAKAAGLTAIGGERLLYHQGLLAFRLWTGLDASLIPKEGAKMRIALAQYESKTGDIAFNIAQIEKALAACSGKAELVMFGESFLQGFDAFIGDYEKDDAVAIPRDGEIMRRIEAICESCGVGLIFGYFERDGEDLYSSCAVIEGGRLAHNYRRISPGWKELDLADRRYKEGDSALKFTYSGREFSLALCGDLWDFPEKFKTDGVLLWPVYLSFLPEDWLENEADYAAQASLCANRALMINPIVNGEWPCCGGAFIIENGRLTEKLPYCEEGILIAEI